MTKADIHNLAITAAHLSENIRELQYNSTRIANHLVELAQLVSRLASAVDEMYPPSHGPGVLDTPGGVCGGGISG